jgi:hypothetical protein
MSKIQGSNSNTNNAHAAAIQSACSQPEEVHKLQSPSAFASFEGD